MPSEAQSARTVPQQGSELGGICLVLGEGCGPTTELDLAGSDPNLHITFSSVTAPAEVGGGIRGQGHWNSVSLYLLLKFQERQDGLSMRHLLGACQACRRQRVCVKPSDHATQN